MSTPDAESTSLELGRTWTEYGRITAESAASLITNTSPVPVYWVYQETVPGARMRSRNTIRANGGQIRVGGGGGLLGRLWLRTTGPTVKITQNR